MYLCNSQVLIPGQKSPKAQALSRINYEQEPKNEDSELNVEDYLSDDDIPDYKLKTNNYSDDDEEKSLPFVSGISFNEFLKKQLTPFNLNEDDSKIAEFLVGSVDQSGYIRTDIVDIVDDLAFTMGIYTDINSVTKILNKIHPSWEKYDVILGNHIYVAINYFEQYQFLPLSFETS